MGDLFDRYAGAATASKLHGGRARPPVDEVFEACGRLRDAYHDVISVVAGMSTEDVAARSARLARAFMDQGVTFDLDGEERPFPLDVLPRVFSDSEWRLVADGIAQRIRALEAFLDDVYHAGRVLRDGVVPPAVVHSAPGFLRQCHGIEPANGVRVHVAGIDVVRDEDGGLRVLEDNLRCPSGVSYVLANRAAMARVLPEVFWGQDVRMVADYPARLVRALRAAAPAGVADPTVVVLTPGVHNSAFYEHALLARLMGVHLVEGRDLVCHGTDVFLRTTDGELPVHVIYRRIDDEFLDPLQFRPDSLLGCPGLLNAMRAGRVTVANAAGNGVADDKLLYTYVPDLIRYYLSEEPLLENVSTYRLIDPEERREALARRSELVFKRVDGSGGKGLVVGPHASAEELNGLAAAIERAPRSWIAQRTVALSTAPTWVDGGMVPRHVDLRPFAINDGEHIWVLPGGLTRVALAEGGLVVNSSQGGGSKDTWVLDRPTTRARVPLQPLRPAAGRSSPLAPGPPMDTGPPVDAQRSQQQ